MPLLPTRRRSFIVEDENGLTQHRSFASARSAGSDDTTNSLASAQQPLLRRGLTARGVLLTVVLLLMSYAAGSSRSCTTASSQSTSATSPSIDVHGNRNTSTAGGDQHAGTGFAGLPPDDPRHRPYYDLVVAVFVASKESQEEIARVRKVYARYGSEVVPDRNVNGGTVKNTPPLAFKVVFVVGRAGLPEDVQLPDTGLLLGDFYHVDVREGYNHLSDKTKAMTGLSDHLR